MDLTDPATPCQNALAYDRLTAIEARQAVSSERMDRFEVELIGIAERGREVHEMLLAWRAGLGAIAKLGRGLARVGSWLISLLRVLGPVLAAITAICVAVNTFIHRGHS